MQQALGRSSRELRLRVLELGAGDGSLMLRIAHELSKSWPAVHVTLLDRLALLTADTSAAFARLGWSVEMLSVDVLDWAAAPLPPHLPPRWDVIVANLFLHHFDELRLPRLVVRNRRSMRFVCRLRAEARFYTPHWQPSRWRVGRK
jgi:hypothetical protein